MVLGIAAVPVGETIGVILGGPMSGVLGELAGAVTTLAAIVVSVFGAIVVVIRGIIREQ